MAKLFSLHELQAVDLVVAMRAAGINRENIDQKKALRVARRFGYPIKDEKRDVRRFLQRLRKILREN